jgi:hypothetical protein
MHPQTPRCRVIVIANETIKGQILHDSIVAKGDVEVLVVAPALNSRLRHWTSDEDGARVRATARLNDCVAALGEAGVNVRGWIGDADPMRAIADALVLFPADELIIATHPEQRSNWLAHDLVRRARNHFGMPVAHIVVEHAGLATLVASAA